MLRHVLYLVYSNRFGEGEVYFSTAGLFSTDVLTIDRILALLSSAVSSLAASVLLELLSFLELSLISGLPKNVVFLSLSSPSLLF